MQYVFVAGILQIILGALCSIFLHEFLHYLGMRFCNVRIRAFVLTWWTGMGFIAVNEDFITNNRRLAAIYFLPLPMSLVFFIDPSNLFLIIFSIANIAGAVGDMYICARLLRMKSDERIEWANRIDNNILNKALWKKVFPINDRR